MEPVKKHVHHCALAKDDQAQVFHGFATRDVVVTAFSQGGYVVPEITVWVMDDLSLLVINRSKDDFVTRIVVMG
jgi:hypothetical protein